MSTVSTIVTLLDAAKTVTGSDYATAKAIGTTTQIVSNWRHGRRTAQPEDLALIAGLAGLDAEEVLVRAIIEKHANTSKGERLLNVLGNVLRRTGEAVTLGFFVSVAWGLIPGNADARTSPKASGDNVHRVRRQSGKCQMLRT